MLDGVNRATKGQELRMAIIIFAALVAAFGVIIGLAATNFVGRRVANSPSTVHMQRGAVAALMAIGGVVLNVDAAVSVGPHRYVDIAVAAILLFAAAAVLRENRRDRINH